MGLAPRAWGGDTQVAGAGGVCACPRTVADPAAASERSRGSSRVRQSCVYPRSARSKYSRSHGREQSYIIPVASHRSNQQLIEDIRCINPTLIFGAISPIALHSVINYKLLNSKKYILK